MTDVELVLRLTAAISGLYAIYSGFELLSLRRHYTDGGLMSWRIVKLSISYAPGSTFLEPILARYQYVLAGRLVAGALLMMFAAVGGTVWETPIIPLLFVALAGTDLVTKFRHPGGLSGAHDMSLVVNFGMIIATLAPTESHVQTIAILFVAVQGVMGYFLAGVAKGLSEEWRNGRAIEMVFSTKTWGDDRVYRFVQGFPQSKYLASWTVIGFELIFVLVLIVDPHVTLLLFCIAFAFHVFNAVFMGINGFLVIFPSTYPAIYYVNHLIGVAYF